MNPQNLHSLVSGTGGAVFRVADENTQDADAVIKGLAVRFHKALAVPVLETTKVTLAGEPAELYPAKLPPLRADVPTLVVGRFEKGATTDDVWRAMGRIIEEAGAIGNNVGPARPPPRAPADRTALAPSGRRYPYC